MNQFENIYVEELSHYVPERIVTNDELIQKNSLKMKASWIEHNIGISERRWADPTMAASDLAQKSCSKLDLSDFNGALWLSTISQDYFTPSTSAILKKKLGLECKNPTFDISAACAGWIFALENAAVRLNGTSEKDALVVASEVRSKFLNPKDRRTVFLFGDGAVSCRLSKAKSSKTLLKLNWTHLSTIPAPEMEIFVPGGGSVQPFDQEVLEKDLQYIQMVDGSAIVEATQKNLIEEITNTVPGNINDYELILFHQGNKRLIESIMKKMGLDTSKTYTTFEKFGNSSSASVGVTLSTYLNEKKLTPNSKILLVTFGAGQHMGLAELSYL